MKKILVDFDMSNVARILNLPDAIDDQEPATLKQLKDQSQGNVVYSGQAERTVGGISEGTVFNNSTMKQMWDQLIKQEKFPSLSAPSSSFNSSIEGLREVGEIINIVFNSTFSRGLINPQYSAINQYRSGLPNLYGYSGEGLINRNIQALSDSQTVTGYLVKLGNQSWQGYVGYDAGEQPKSSYDNNFDVPLPAGNTSTINRSINGVYPYFAKTVNITTYTKQPLSAMNATYIQTTIVAEDDLGNKQSIELPESWSIITGIQFYNTVSSAWEWIGGSKANSLLSFNTSTAVRNINGNNINYNQLTHNGAKIGSRQLRWYTT